MPLNCNTSFIDPPKKRPDGLTIVGWGYNPDGYDEAWIATIPEPTTLLLLGFGGLALRRKRRAK